MECPFCAETIKDEAIACRHCSRDLRVVRPVLLEIQDLVNELDVLQRDLDRTKERLAQARRPLHYFANLIARYVIAPAVLLVAAHVVVTIVLNISPLYLRIASVIIPFPFGFAAYPVNRVRFRGALLLGVAVAALSVMCMLAVTGINDNVPIIPQSWGEWREVLEYMVSIALAMVSGNILGSTVFQVLPRILAQGGKPNATAFKAARLLGRHVGEEHVRRRARLIQDFIQTAGPMIGVAATALGSLYAGLKGMIG